MSICPACGSAIAGNGRFCSNCGSGVRARETHGAAQAEIGNDATMDLAATATSPALPRMAAASSSRPSSSAEYLMSEGRFLPGRLLAGRYRIIALLGKGGMGEVYRADDLTLGQAIALKFLPDEAARDESVLERFRNEVRIARRVSHPNVCRVYDVGSVDGQTFFTMEYIDGEDLASLLRRIGRLPQDKALDIARQLCAGLSAAHTKGVLHRDLKPANIMLDGRGQAVITDFGLAGVAGQIDGSDVRSGTPAYMAPEQLSGKEVSARSDIYSLGLVLYEVFTGKRPFAEKPSPSGLATGDRTLSRPSTVVKDLDPVIERVILRCLETEPSARPANVLSVAAALPGGDPLAAALAAGETPSPELVAASGETTGLRPRTALICLASVLVGLAVVMFLGIHYSALDKMALDQSPEVLTQKAREIIVRLGYEGRPVDSAYGLDANGDFADYVEKHDKPRPDWNAVLAARPQIMEYWYRQSPQFMYAKNVGNNFLLSTGAVDESDPPTLISGMINLELDLHGRLIYFQAIPPQKEDSSAAHTPYDWNVLLAAAGIDPAQLQKAEPAWVSLAASDARAAWTGTWPGTTRPLRVEAASFHGKPVFFHLTGDWTKPDRMKDTQESRGKKISQIVFLLLGLSLLFGAGVLARRNYRLGRGDREGAFRLAVVMFVLDILLWFCQGHFVPSLDMFGMFILAISSALFAGGFTWVLYLALEPWVRRRWPQALISWSRMLSGQLRDPLVGRDILFGAILGVVWILVFQVRTIPEIHMGAAPGTANLDYMMGGRQALGAWLVYVPLSILVTLQFFFLMLGLKVVLRKEWLAAIVFVLIFALPRGLTSNYAIVELPAQIVVYSIAALIVFRFGLVPLAVAAFTIDMLGNVPVSSDWSAWYMPTSILALLSVVALAGWGFYHSLGGEQLWQPETG